MTSSIPHAKRPCSVMLRSQARLRRGHAPADACRERGAPKRPVVRGLGLAAIILCAHAAAHAAEPLRIEVRETAGIRRFGYPVSWRFRLPSEVPAATKFQLVDEDRGVAAQFRPASKGDEAREWSLNFNVNLLPYESHRYSIEYGEGVPGSHEPDRGMALERTDDAIKVSNAPYLTFTVPKDLHGLMRSLKTPAAEFFDPDSAGLVLRSGKDFYRLGETAPDTGRLSVQVAKEGPIANALRFTGNQPLAAGASVATVVDLEFVNSKSWVRVDWSVDDPTGAISALGADLNLALDPPERDKPTLVDFGAGTLVYATLTTGHSARLEARRDQQWQVLRGLEGKLEPFVVEAQADGPPSLPEGWAHVMDERRCTAAAVDDFGRNYHDWIEVSSQGRLQIWREFSEAGAATEPGPKTLTFWLHFVSFPPHVGAATSPQSMLAPLEVRMLPADSN